MKQTELEKICNENNLKINKIIHENPFKDSAVLQVFDSNKNKKIVKIYGLDSPKNVRKAFEKEVKFYRDFKNDHMMNMTHTGERFFILDFFDGVSIREFLLKNELKNDIFEKILDDSKEIFNWFFIKNHHNLKNEQIVIDTIFDRIGNLATSGPRNTQKKKIESFLIRQAWKRVEGNLEKSIKQLVKKWNEAGVNMFSEMGHFDMHYDNMLINEKKLILIDFGNVRSPGIWISDVLYFYSTFYAGLGKYPEFQKKVKEQAKKFLKSMDPKMEAENNEKIINLFFSACEMNSRFRIGDKKLKLQKIFHFMKYSKF